VGAVGYLGGDAVIDYGESTDLAGLRDWYPVAVERIASERAARVTRRFLWLLVVGGLLVAYWSAL
jgi:hypothetical protein